MSDELDLEEQLNRGAAVAAGLLKSAEEHIRLGAVNALSSCLYYIGAERQRQFDREQRESQHVPAGNLYLHPGELLDLAKKRGLEVTLDAELQIKVDGPATEIARSVDLVRAINWNGELVRKILAPKPKETP